MRVAYLGPPGTVSDEALTAAAPDARGRAARDAARRRARRPARAGRAGAGPGRERARGRRRPGARRARARGAGRRADRRGRPAGRPTAWPRAASWRSTRSRSCCSHPQALGPVHALAGRAPPAAPRWSRRPRPPTPCARWRGDARRARARRSAPRLAARRYGARDAGRGPRGRPRQRDPLRLARPGGRRAAPARERPGQDRRWSSGAWARAPRAGSSPAWPVFAFAGVNLTRIESRPLRRGMGEYMFFLDLEGSMADPAVAGAVEGLQHARRSGSSPRARSRRRRAD